MSHAFCVLDNLGYRHTLGICNTYVFSTATLVSLARLNVMTVRTMIVLCNIIIIIIGFFLFYIELTSGLRGSGLDWCRSRQGQVSGSFNHGHWHASSITCWGISWPAEELLFFSKNDSATRSYLVCYWPKLPMPAFLLTWKKLGGPFPGNNGINNFLNAFHADCTLTSMR